MSTVQLDPQHLDAVARALAGYGDRTDALLARARALGAADDVAPLAGTSGWAGATARDLRVRAELVRMTEAMRISTLTGLALSPLNALGGPGSTPLLAAAYAPLLARLADLAPPLHYGRLEHEPVGDWVTRLVGEAVGHYTPIPGDPVTEALRLLQTQASVLAAVGGSGVASVSLVKRALSALLVRQVPGSLQRDVPLLRWLGAREAWRYKAGGWMHTTGLVKSPGTLPAFLAKPWEQASHLQPGQLSTLLEGQTLKELNQRSETLRRWLGRGWLDPRDLERLAHLRPPDVSPQAWERMLTGPRGANNLVTVFRQTKVGADGHTLGFFSKVEATGKAAGRLRVAGIAGQVVATGLSAQEMLDKDHAKAWREDKADYLSDVANTAFNGSLTAMMVAPSPFTAGAVAVTGIAYAGTELWDHWDGVKAWSSDGGPRRAAEKVGDVAKGGLEAAGKALDTIKKVDLNPF